jgi:hypothetical protein
LLFYDALCIISPSTEADMQIPNWTDDPRVAPLLDAMRDTPPTVRWFEIPSRSCLFGRDRVWEYVHPSIPGLKAIENEYFKRLDPIEKEQGYDAYRKAALAFVNSGHSVADLIERVEAERARLAA